MPGSLWTASTKCHWEHTANNDRGKKKSQKKKEKQSSPQKYLISNIICGRAAWTLEDFICNCSMHFSIYIQVVITLLVRRICQKNSVPGALLQCVLWSCTCQAAPTVSDDLHHRTPFQILHALFSKSQHLPRSPV